MWDIKIPYTENESSILETRMKPVLDIINEYQVQNYKFVSLHIDRDKSRYVTFRRKTSEEIKIETLENRLAQLEAILKGV